MRFIPAWMRRQWLVLGSLLVLILITPNSANSFGAPRGQQTASKAQASAQAQVATAEAEEIRQLIVKYTTSVDKADTELASQVWLDSPDVSFIHPLGHEHGFEQIKQNVYKRLMGDTFSERELTAHDISVHVYRDAAWAEFYWDFVAKYRKDGSPVTTHGRESQVYLKIQGRWRLVHVHYSGMPVTEEGKGF
jgi:ketosteroid isomerase-like protein